MVVSFCSIARNDPMQINNLCETVFAFHSTDGHGKRVMGSVAPLTQHPSVLVHDLLKVRISCEVQHFPGIFLQIDQ